MKKIIDRYNKDTILYAVICCLLPFALMLYIAKCAPLLSDDIVFLEWGADSIREAVSYSLHYGNGRFLGNFLTVYLIQHPLIMNIERAFVLTAIVLLFPKAISKTSGNKRLFLTFITFIAFFGMSPLIFSHVITWVSGFHNYVPPVLLLIVSLLLVKSNENKRIIRVLSCIALFVFGVASQLFVELNSVINICFTVAVIIYYCFTDKTKIKKCVIWLISEIIGAAVMFAIPVVFKMYKESPTNFSSRAIYLRNIPELISNAVSVMMRSISVLSRFEIIFISVAVILLVLLKKYQSNWRNKKINKLCFVSLTVFIFASLFTAFAERYTVFTGFKTINEWYLIFILIFFFIPLISVIIHLPKGKEKIKVIICSVFIVLSFGPMLVVAPFSNRCLFLSYVFFIADILMLSDYAVKDIQDVRIKNFNGIIAIIAVMITISLTLVFTDIGWQSAQQTKYIEAKIAEKPSEIEIFDYNSDFIHIESIYGMGYHYYNEKAYDIEFKHIPFEEWYNNRINEGWF